MSAVLNGVSWRLDTEEQLQDSLDRRSKAKAESSQSCCDLGDVHVVRIAMW